MKCSDYYCIRFYNLPDDLKMKGKNGKIITVDNHVEWHNACKALYKVHHDLLDGILQHVFNKPSQFFYKNYLFFREQCIIELLDYYYDIKYIPNHSYGVQFMIPVKYVQLIDWVKQNQPPYARVLTRYNIHYLEHRKPKKLNWVAENKKETENWIAKNPAWGPYEEITKKDIKQLV